MAKEYKHTSIETSMMAIGFRTKSMAEESSRTLVEMCILVNGPKERSMDKEFSHLLMVNAIMMVIGLRVRPKTVVRLVKFLNNNSNSHLFPSETFL